MSPAIITETLYALATAQDKWIPDQILVYTTESGRRQVISKLLNSGIYAELCSFLQITLDFNPASIHVIGSEDQVLNDIRTPDDSIKFADFVSRHILNLTKNPHHQLYVSMAGGRKTMSYYVGYSMSLYGRIQDKLLHVLVNSPFDTLAEFYYPAQNCCLLKLENTDTIYAREAKIDLINIPFIRMRSCVPDRLIKGKISFSEAVANIQAILNTKEYHLIIDIASRSLICDGIAVKLTGYQFAIYVYLAHLKQSQNAYVPWREIDTTKILDTLAKLYTGGKASARYQQVYKTISGSSFETSFREQLSKINKIVKSTLEFDAFTIDAIKVGNVTNYGIKIDPLNISII